MNLKLSIFLIATLFCFQARTEDLTAITSFQLSTKLKNRALALKAKSFNKNVNSNQADPNSMYSEIYEYLNGKHLDLGKALSDNIIRMNRGFDLGQQNFNGITWQKPFAHFKIGVNRQLSPDLFDVNRWIVDDTFTILIDAETYLSKLNEANEISITETQLAGFAGMSFKRTFRYIHFASDYNSGLASDFNKLFMSFWIMRKGNIFNIDQYEIISREDSMSFKSGGLISTPPISGIEVSAGVLARMTKLSKVQIQSVGPHDDPAPNEFLRISSEKEKIIRVDAQAKLQADFFKLLKITLLSYDTDYSFEEVDRRYFSFKKSDIQTIQANAEINNELNEILNLKKLTSESILKYQTQAEFRSKENFNSKYAVLLWGGETSRGSQTILINKENNSKAFVRHISKTVRFTEDVGSKLAGIILAAIFQSDNLISQYIESLTRILEIEFDADRAALEGGQYDRIKELDSSDKLSFKVTKEYKTRKVFKKVKDWKKSKEFDQTINFLSKMCAFNSTIFTSIDKGEIHSPLAVTSTLRIEKDAIIYFNNLDSQVVIDTLNEMCHLSETESSKQDYCSKMLEGKYLAYIQPLKNTKKIHVLKLRDFLYSFNNQYDDISFYKKLFGEDLVFYSGQLEASRDDGQIITTYFHDGEFRGLGIIDNYIRKSGTAMPAPIYNNLE
jgi:hypothetical protein